MNSKLFQFNQIFNNQKLDCESIHLKPKINANLTVYNDQMMKSNLIEESLIGCDCD
jgi:hypothetical protein